MVMVGGVLVILGVAMGLTSYMVDAEVPAQAGRRGSRRRPLAWLFLLALNVFLLIVGCLMDIFSAIVVVVPLILPIAGASASTRCTWASSSSPISSSAT